MRPQVVVFITFAVCALGVPLALSFPSVANAAMSPCYDKAMSQAALHQCADADARASQQRLDAAYATLQKSVSGAELRGVQADQREWLDYRNANCKSVSNVDLPDAGSRAPEVNLECVALRNEQRITYLKWRASSPDFRQQHAMP